MSFYRETKVKACRKPCRCDWCDERINKGDAKVCTAGMNWDDDFFSANYHPECHEAANKWAAASDHSEDLPLGGMKRGSTEER